MFCHWLYYILPELVVLQQLFTVSLSKPYHVPGAFLHLRPEHPVVQRIIRLAAGRYFLPSGGIHHLHIIIFQHQAFLYLVSLKASYIRFELGILFDAPVHGKDSDFFLLLIIYGNALHICYILMLRSIMLRR